MQSCNVPLRRVLVVLLLLVGLASCDKPFLYAPVSVSALSTGARNLEILEIRETKSRFHPSQLEFLVKCGDVTCNVLGAGGSDNFHVWPDFVWTNDSQSEVTIDLSKVSFRVLDLKPYRRKAKTIPEDDAREVGKGKIERIERVAGEVSVVGEAGPGPAVEWKRLEVAGESAPALRLESGQSATIVLAMVVDCGEWTEAHGEWGPHGRVLWRTAECDTWFSIGDGSEPIGFRCTYKLI